MPNEMQAAGLFRHPWLRLCISHRVRSSQANRTYRLQFVAQPLAYDVQNHRTKPHPGICNCRRSDSSGSLKRQAAAGAGQDESWKGWDVKEPAKEDNEDDWGKW